jgi:tryptophan synthase beta subunit
VRLDEQRRTLGIEPGGEKVDDEFDAALLYVGSIGVVGGECVPVSNEEEALLLLLELNPVLQGADIVPKMKFSGGTHPT